ncbi:hypothetical protein SDC9_62633 [bioreactor metagenome]|uniref:Uncharacterized protein n=1 Tax=bioreactor metagenome TaxID=1076179 RepID=A0A644XJ99_9ZZZZ
MRSRERAKISLRAIASGNDWYSHCQRFCCWQIKTLTSGWQYDRMRSAIKTDHATVIQREFINDDTRRILVLCCICLQQLRHLVVRIWKRLNVKFNSIVAIEGFKKCFEQYINTLAMKCRRYMQKSKRHLRLRHD